MTAIHAVLVKSAHEIVGDNSVIKLTYWSNLLSALLLVPCIFANGELSPLLFSKDRDWTVFITGSAVTGVCGFLLCMAGLLSIKVTSPITHMFSSVSIPPAFELKANIKMVSDPGRPKCGANASRCIIVW